MNKLVFAGFLLLLGSFLVTNQFSYAQTNAMSPTATMSPSPTHTVPSGAPSTGFGH